MSIQTLATHAASCHCLKFLAPKQLEIIDCNCSICTKKGFLHYIVPKEHFTLIKGDKEQSLYTFGHHIAKHYFCSTCGICVYYIPRSNPDGFDINFRCVDQSTIESYTTTPFDGRDNWDKQAGALEHLSKS